MAMTNDPKDLGEIDWTQVANPIRGEVEFHDMVFGTPSTFHQDKFCFVYCGDDACNCMVRTLGKSLTKDEVIVYTRHAPPCMWCTRVKVLLADNNIPFTEVQITRGLWVDLCAKWGQQVTTVPQVEVNGERIGGFDDTKKWIENRSNVGL